MRKKKKISQNRPIKTMQADAAKLLVSSHYKDAIEAYKRLLKKERREEWQTALAQAYLRRAQTLADKGMYKEAAVLWENRANLCPDKECIDQYILWLIRSGRHIRAARLFSESAEQLPDNITRQLLANFGALLLAGYSDITAAFPEDTVLFKQYTLIRDALQAYFQGQGDDKTAEDLIKKIPFRSPYRDFRTIFKALLMIEADPNACSKLLEKVPADSPYTQFAALIRIAGQDGETLLKALSKLSHHEQILIAGLKGWDKAQVKIISMLQTAAKRDGSHKALLEVVAANRQTLGDNYSRQFCLALLPSYPAGMKFYERTFGPLSAFEKNRIIALNSERQEQTFRIVRYWRLCVDDLKPDPNNAIKVATIWRHLVELAERRGEEFDDDTVPNDLAESIRFDPDDKASYLKLIQWYDHQDDKNNYHKWVETAVKQFPKESDILLAGMKSATHKKAFKKAARFAKTLLKVDPINVKARQIARNSHISHARKLIKSGKYELARKELDQAAHLEKTNRRSGVVQINQGLLELQAEGLIVPKTRIRSKATAPALSTEKLKAKIKNPQAINLLNEGVQQAGGGICGQFRLIVETKSQNLELAPILLLVPPACPGSPDTPDRHEVLELIRLINAYSEEGTTFIKMALDQLSNAPLQKAAKLDFSQEEMLSLCECFKKLEHNGLLRQFANQALKRWSEQPIFVFYQIYSKSGGMLWQMPMQDMERLREAADRADEQGDQRTAMIIGGFLNKMMPSSFFNPFDDVVEEDELEDINEEMEALKNKNLDDVNPAELIKILNRLEEIGIEISDLDIPIPQLPGKKKQRKR